MKNFKKTKIAVIGAGFVGSTTVYTLMQSGLVSEIVLVDINTEKAEGEVMDLNHGMPFVKPVNVYAGNYADCKDADVIIITAGANQKEGETRIDLVHKNTVIFKNIINEILKYNTEGILLVVTNPVDILTYLTYKISGFPKNRVIGSGTVLDTARFRYLLAEHVQIDPRNVHAYIIGEHGDTEVAAWSMANIAGIDMDKYCETCHGCENGFSRNEIYKEVKNAAYEIIKKKGATYYAVGIAVRRIVEAIIRDEKSILTVSSFIEDKFGISDVCLSLPAIVDRTGVNKILDMPINDSEKQELYKSANAIREILKQMKPII